MTVGGVTDAEGNTEIPARKNTFVIAGAATDLSITVAASPNPVARLSIITYGITVSNNGSSDATGVSITNTMPAHVAFVSSSAGSPTCDEIDRTVTCTMGSLAIGATANVTIEATVDPAAAEGVIVNAASVTGDQSDPDPVNNVAISLTDVLIGQLSYSLTIRDGNLDTTDITLTDSPDPVFVGLSLTYTLNVTNQGTDQVTGVILTIALPAAVGFESVTISFIGAAPLGGISSSLPGIGPGDRNGFGFLAGGLNSGGVAYLPGRLLGTGGLTWTPAGRFEKANLFSQIACTEDGGTVVCGLGVLSRN